MYKGAHCARAPVVNVTAVNPIVVSRNVGLHRRSRTMCMGKILFGEITGSKGSQGHSMYICLKLRIITVGKTRNESNKLIFENKIMCTHYMRCKGAPPYIYIYTCTCTYVVMQYQTSLK